MDQAKLYELHGFLDKCLWRRATVREISVIMNKSMTADEWRYYYKRAHQGLPIWVCDCGRHTRNNPDAR